MTAYYNEIDPYAAQWLRNLIAAGHIAAGDVDERDIRLVQPDDLRGYQQCHFFAGVGVWSYALRLAGWPDDEPVWTGSCPCQPFSDAGRKSGLGDERHLWPTWSRLIVELRPIVVFGEQVAGADGLAWLDFVCADLEVQGYSIGPFDLCAAGVGAPHIRQRLFFVADADRERRTGERLLLRAEETGRVSSEVPEVAGSCEASELADAGRWGFQRGRERGELHGEISQDGQETQPCPLQDALGRSGEASLMEYATSDGRARRAGEASIEPEGEPSRQAQQRSCALGGVEHAAGEQVGIPGRARLPGATAGFWSDAEWLPCIDGKWRAVEPGTFPLANGVAARVGRLRAYGNAINAEVAAEFIGTYLDMKTS